MNKRLDVMIGVMVGVMGILLLMFGVNADAEGIPDPIAWWKFDETSGTTAPDCKGGHTGTLYNMEDIDWVPGIHGNALIFDGTNEYVRISNAPDLNPGTGDFTWSMWVYIDALPDNRYIFSKWQDSANRFHLSIMSIAWNHRLSFYSATTAAGAINSTRTVDGGTDIWSTGDWHHIVYVADRTTPTQYIYLNGDPLTLEASATDSSSITNTGDLYVGCSRTGAGAFPGIIDEVMIWNEALTDDQISWLYKHPGQLPKKFTLIRIW